MAEYIDREIATEIIDNYAKTISKDCLVVYQAIRDIVDTICPTIEAKPVVHAHWKTWGCEGTVCSNCHGRVLYECDEQEKKSKYCPNCGAQMDEGVKIPVISMEDVPKLAKEMEK